MTQFVDGPGTEQPFGKSEGATGRHEGASGC